MKIGFFPSLAKTGLRQTADSEGVSSLKLQTRITDLPSGEEVGWGSGVADPSKSLNVNLSREQNHRHVFLTTGNSHG